MQPTCTSALSLLNLVLNFLESAVSSFFIIIIVLWNALIYHTLRKPIEANNCCCKWNYKLEFISNLLVYAKLSLLSAISFFCNNLIFFSLVANVVAWQTFKFFSRSKKVRKKELAMGFRILFLFERISLFKIQLYIYILFEFYFQNSYVKVSKRFI